MKIHWIASYGPDRSHDTLNSDVFSTRGEALAFVANKDYWRISRMEYTASYAPGKRTDEIGGVDVDREIEKTRIDAQYRTGRRVSTKEALALWRKRMGERHGPGGAWRNPCATPGMRIRSKGRGKGLARGRGRGPRGFPARCFRNAVLTQPDFTFQPQQGVVIFKPLTKLAKVVVKKLDLPSAQRLGEHIVVDAEGASLLIDSLSEAGFLFAYAR